MNKDSARAELMEKLQLFFAERKRPYSPETIRAYLDDIKGFIEFLKKKRKEKPLADATTEDVRRYIAYLSTRGVTNPRTVCRKIAGLSAYYKYLIRKGACHSNPTLDAGRPELPDHYASAPITVQEFRTLISTVNSNGFHSTRDRAVLEMLYGCGLTVGELTRLDVADVDLTTGNVFVRKPKRSRSVPAGKPVVDAVTRYLRTRERLPHRRKPNDHPLSINRFGDRIDKRSIRKLIAVCARKAGLPHITPSTLRTSFACHGKDQGVSTQLLQNLLGHRQSSTTLRMTRAGTQPVP